MKYDIPIDVFASTLSAIGLLNKKDAKILNNYVKADQFHAYLGYIKTKGIIIDNDGDYDQPDTCVDQMFSIEIPDTSKNEQYKSIW